MFDAADRTFLDLAIEQARIGWDEGGIPIGAALVHEGEVLGRRPQPACPDGLGDPARRDRLPRERRPPPGRPDYRASTLYTTLSPCFMCAGTAVLYDIPRIVVGENRSFEASESWLASRGVEIVVADDAQCKALMDTMIAEKPELWAEDIGEEA